MHKHGRPDRSIIHSDNTLKTDVPKEGLHLQFLLTYCCIWSYKIVLKIYKIIQINMTLAKTGKKSFSYLSFRTIRFGENFASVWSKYISNNVSRDFVHPVSEFATVAREEF